MRQKAGNLVVALHWAFFARRYKDVPNERVSFNLWNEPGRTDTETHKKVAGRSAALHAVRGIQTHLVLACGFPRRLKPGGTVHRQNAGATMVCCPAGGACAVRDHLTVELRTRRNPSLVVRSYSYG